MFTSPSFNKVKLPTPTAKESNRFLTNQNPPLLENQRKSIGKIGSMPEIYMGKDTYLFFRKKQ